MKAGSIVIGTEVDTSGVETGLYDIEDITKQIEERIGKKLPKEITDDIESGLADASKLIQEFEDKLQEYYDAYNEANSGGVIFKSDLENVANLKQEVKNMIPLIEELTEDRVIIPGINDIEPKLKKVSFNLTGLIKKVGRWGLAIFGVRGAFMAVRSAMNLILGDDEQLKADFNYMKNALYYTLEPVVRVIVGLVKDIMIAIQHIIFALTGKNVFENANKSLKGANKNAQALSKTMAKFDEMQTVGDQGGGGGGGSAMPGMDLTQINGLTDRAKALAGILTAVAGAIALMKLSDLLKTLGLINEALTVTQGLGIFLIILSLYNIIMDIIDILNKFDETVQGNNTTLKDWGDVLLWVGVGIVGIGLLIAGLPVIVVGAIVAIIALIMKYWEEIRTFFTEKVFGWLDKMIEKLNKSTIGKFFATFLEETKRVIGDVIHVFDGLFSGLKQIFDGIVLIFKGHVVDGLVSMAKGLVNAIISAINVLVAGLNTLVAPFRAIIVGMGKIAGKNWSMENIRFPSLRYLAKGGIINMPGRGIPVGSAIAGERGREAVIPLTDSQQMALIGESIGKYVTINATIPVNVGNRLVLREMKRIKAEDDFAYNR